jgi:NADPH:quinone reductase-like Zn-dependent oxidoreductase
LASSFNTVRFKRRYVADMKAPERKRELELLAALSQHTSFSAFPEFHSDQLYDVIVDLVGNHPVSANRGVLKPTGALVIVGARKGDWFGPLANPLKAMLTAPFVDQKLGMFIAQFNKEDMETLADLMASGAVTPVIDRRYSLSETADAIRYSEEGHARGKIIITME